MPHSHIPYWCYNNYGDTYIHSRVPIITLHTIVKLLIVDPPRRGQPLYKGQNNILSPTCPLFRGSAVCQYGDLLICSFTPTQATRKLQSSNVPTVSGAAVQGWFWTVCMGRRWPEEYWSPSEGDRSSLGNIREPLSWTAKLICHKRQLV